MVKSEEPASAMLRHVRHDGGALLKGRLKLRGCPGDHRVTQVSLVGVRYLKVTWNPCVYRKRENPRAHRPRGPVLWRDHPAGAASPLVPSRITGHRPTGGQKFNWPRVVFLLVLRSAYLGARLHVSRTPPSVALSSDRRRKPPH